MSAETPRFRRLPVHDLPIGETIPGLKSTIALGTPEQKKAAAFTLRISTTTYTLLRWYPGWRGMVEFVPQNPAFKMMFDDGNVDVWSHPSDGPGEHQRVEFLLSIFAQDRASPQPGEPILRIQCGNNKHFLTTILVVSVGPNGSIKYTRDRPVA